MPQDTTPVRSPGPPPRWSVVLPVKGGPDAKSRLVHPARAALARAFALDAVAAVLGCPGVAEAIVVTADDEAAVAHRALGARVLRDPGGGLTQALLAGRDAAAPDRRCALLLADLPALRPQDLHRALTACCGSLEAGAAQVCVPDADGFGTVLLAAARPADLRPAFGPGSAAAHARSGTVLADAPARLRRDVDTAVHLHEAEQLGLGTRTAAVLAAAVRST